MYAYLLSAAFDTLKLMAVSTLVTLLCLAYRRTRRLTFAMFRFTKRYAPRWAIPVLAVCGLIPGQADEAIVFVIILIPILRHAHKRRMLSRYARVAWYG